MAEFTLDKSLLYNSLKSSTMVLMTKFLTNNITYRLPLNAENSALVLVKFNADCLAIPKLGALILIIFATWSKYSASENLWEYLLSSYPYLDQL